MTNATATTVITSGHKAAARSLNDYLRGGVPVHAGVAAEEVLTSAMGWGPGLYSSASVLEAWEKFSDRVGEVNRQRGIAREALSAIIRTAYAYDDQLTDGYSVSRGVNVPAGHLLAAEAMKFSAAIATMEALNR